MSELEEVMMALTPLVKRDHPRWTMNRCKRYAEQEAKKFLAVPRKRMDWSKLATPEQCDIGSKHLQVF